MEEQLISFETAKLAKEKGFNEFSNNLYSLMSENLIKDSKNKNSDSDDKHREYKFVSVPTQSLLQKWIREVHNIEILINRIPPEAVLASKNNGKNILNNYSYYVWSLNNNPRIANKGSFKNTYEEALEVGLQEALKLIK